jgi:hypothetical protein
MLLSKEHWSALNSDWLLGIDGRILLKWILIGWEVLDLIKLAQDRGWSWVNVVVNCEVP